MCANSFSNFRSLAILSNEIVFLLPTIPIPQMEDVAKIWLNKIKASTA